MAKYKLSKTVGNTINSDQGKEWIQRWSDKHKDGIKAYFYGADILNSIINQEGAVGMRIYFGYGDDDQIQLVLVGTREDGTNIWPEGTSAARMSSPGAVDNGSPCPPYC